MLAVPKSEMFLDSFISNFGLVYTYMNIYMYYMKTRCDFDIRTRLNKIYDQ